MTDKKQLIQMRDELVEKLVSEGMDYDGARFQAMTAANKASGVLQDQPKSTEEDVEKLGEVVKGYKREAPKFSPSPRAYGDAIADADGRDE